MPERIRYSISAPPADILTVLTYSYGPKMTCCEKHQSHHSFLLPQVNIFIFNIFDNIGIDTTIFINASIRFMIIDA